MIPKKFLLEFPELRQTFSFDCGASVLQSVLIYYGCEEREDEIMKELDKESKNFKTNGADIKAITKIAEKYGFESVVEYDLSITTVKNIIYKGMPVIMLLQAWHKEKPFDYSNSYDDGHYVVAIGWNSDKVIFEDPSSYNRVYLTETDLLTRWHGISDDGKEDKRSLSIIIDGEPKFKKDKLSKMG